MIRRMGMVMMLVATVFGSAIVVVYAQHRARTLFAELQTLQSARDQLSVEWGKLQLEQSTWATDGRIERKAADRLDMVMPKANDMVIVRP